MIDNYKAYFGDWRISITDSYIKLTNCNTIGIPTNLGSMLFLHYKKGQYPTYEYKNVEGESFMHETKQIGIFKTDEYLMKIIHEENEASSGEIILTDKDESIILIHLYHIPEIVIAALHLLGCNKVPMFGIPYYEHDSEDSGYTCDAEFSSDDEYN
jgi:hypothetical protein